jgi:hypothetical protein
MPMSSSVLTAARLLDIRSATRMVITSLREWSSGSHAPSSVMIGTLRLRIIVAGV